MSISVPLFRPVIAVEEASRAVAQVLASGYVGEGPRCAELERSLATLFGHERLLLTSSGTAALKLAFVLAGARPGAEVISTPQTCLHEGARVRLADGTSVPIGEMVRERFDGEVLTRMPDGRIGARSVVGWHRTPIGDRRWMFVTHAYANRCAAGIALSGGVRGVWVTNDHPILTTDGYVQADAIEGRTLVLARDGLTGLQREVVIGSLLGDGHLQRGVRGQARLELCHAASQRDWFDLKAGILGGLGTVRTVPARPGHQEALYFQSSASVEFSQLRESFYAEDRRRRVPAWMSEKDMTDAVLATWYLDDGHLTWRTALFCTERYSDDDLARLVSLLQSRGFDTATRCGGNGKASRRIRITGGDKFFRTIAPLVPPSMRYKLPADIRSEIPFSPSKWFDRTPVGQVSARALATTGAPPNFGSASAKWAYCLDVEETHNFFVGDVILHNCHATNAAIADAGATIVWADVDPATGCIDPVDAASKVTSRTVAICGVDWAGRPCRFGELRDLVRGVTLIEDAAHAFLLGGRSRGDLVCYSFQAIKHLCMADGGALVCASAALHERGRLLRWFGLDRTRGDSMRCYQSVSEVGYKLQSNDVLAAVGLANLPRAQQAVARCRATAHAYAAAIGGMRYVQCEPVDPEMSYWMFPLRVSSPIAFERFMREHGVEVGAVHSRNDTQPCFKGARHAFELPGVDSFCAHQSNLPTMPHVADDLRDLVIRALEAWDREPAARW